MATITPIAYNTGSTISGTIQIGNLSVGDSPQDYGVVGSNNGVVYYATPDQEIGYVIAHEDPTGGHNGKPGNVPAYLGFWRSQSLTDNSFVSLVNYLFDQNFPSAVEASIWLNDNGYWTSYTTPVLYLDAGNPLSYPGSGTVWTDLVGNRVFNLINGPSYSSGFGGLLNFNAASSQYAQCDTSLPSLSAFTTSVWTYWDGTNVGSLPCILTEIYTGGPINYFVGNLLGVVAQGGYFNGSFQVSPQFTLVPNNWYNIVVTCDQNQVVKIYLNNSLVSTTQTFGSLPSSSNQGIRLMRRWDDPDFWGGLLSIVTIYDKPLSFGQITALWNSNKDRFGL